MDSEGPSEATGSELPTQSASPLNSGALPSSSVHEILAPLGQDFVCFPLSAKNSAGHRVNTKQILRADSDTQV